MEKLLALDYFSLFAEFISGAFILRRIAFKRVKQTYASAFFVIFLAPIFSSYMKKLISVYK